MAIYGYKVVVFCAEHLQEAVVVLLCMQLPLES